MAVLWYMQYIVGKERMNIINETVHFYFDAAVFQYIHALGLNICGVQRGGQTIINTFIGIGQ